MVATASAFSRRGLPPHRPTTNSKNKFVEATTAAFRSPDGQAADLKVEVRATPPRMNSGTTLAVLLQCPSSVEASPTQIPQQKRLPAE